MIQKIILHLGTTGTSQNIIHFLCSNATLLGESGVVYPPPPNNLSKQAYSVYSQQSCPDYYDHNFLNIPFRNDNLCPHDIPLCLLYMKNIYKKYAATEKKYVLVFSWPPFVTHFSMHSANGAIDFFQSVFPGIPLHIVLDLPCQPRALEEDINYLILAGRPVLSFFSGFFRTIYVYDELYSTLKRSLPPSGTLSASIVHGVEEYPESIKKLIAHLEISLTTEYNTTPPAVVFPFPRDLLDFMSHINRAKVINYKMTQELFSINWHAELDLLQSGRESTSILSPQDRAKIIATHLQHNNALAALSGLPNLIDDQTEFDALWEPYTGLTEEKVAPMIATLSPASRETVQNLFEHIPRIHQWAELRTIANCLKEKTTIPPVFLKKKTPKVTVLSLTYNHAELIKNCIEGVFAQETNFPIEHVISDDGSTDGTQDIIKDYAAKHSHITPLFKYKHQNWVEGDIITRLFKMARSQYVSLCDGDDFFSDPLKLQKQADFLDANPRYSICFHPVLMTWQNNFREDRDFPSGRDIPPHKQPYTLTDLVRWNFMSTSSVMYRWRFATGLPSWFNTSALPGDWYWHMLHAEMGRIGMLPDTMSVYRRHNKGIWKYAETDLMKHKATYGIRELNTYVAMDEHFQGRFRNIFSQRILHEFAMLFELNVYHGNAKPFDDAIRQHPEWAKEVLDMIKAKYNVGDEGDQQEGDTDEQDISS